MPVLSSCNQASLSFSIEGDPGKGTEPLTVAEIVGENDLLGSRGGLERDAGVIKRVSGLVRLTGWSSELDSYKAWRASESDEVNSRYQQLLTEEQRQHKTQGRPIALNLVQARWQLGGISQHNTRDFRLRDDVLKGTLNITVDRNMVTGTVAFVSDLTLESLGCDAFGKNERIESPADAFGSAKAPPAIEGVVTNGIWVLLPPDIDKRL